MPCMLNMLISVLYASQITAISNMFTVQAICNICINKHLNNTSSIPNYMLFDFLTSRLTTRLIKKFMQIFIVRFGSETVFDCKCQVPSSQLFFFNNVSEHVIQ